MSIKRQLADRRPQRSGQSDPGRRSRQPRRQQHHQRASRPRRAAGGVQQPLQPQHLRQPGRTYKGHTTDYGVSLQADWKLGANTTLTSISAWRDYRSGQPGDIDYSAVDILYRSPTNDGFSRHFRTLSQELRLQGTTFNNHLDWLIGGYYADENLTLTDNLRFGTQYGRFATCRIVSGGGLAALYSPTSPGCLAARPALFGAASPLIFAGFDRLDAVNDKGSTLDMYHQNSRNYAFFTHNIFHITDKVAFTAGLRYTNERKRFNATFGQDNTACPAQQAALDQFLTNPALAAVAGGLLAFTCQGNATSELNGVTITDRRSEHKLTGTGVLSWKPIEDLMVYASYSRGYKAGGFNLDRSALKSPLLPFAATPGGAQALVGNLQFDPEINNAYELGAKYSHGVVTANLAIFRQDFRNFQLNTFNGTVFLVQTINGCKTSLNGADRDLSATTGACPAGDVTWGVRSQGVELETAFRPTRNLDITAGFTYANTKYRSNLVGNSSGAPLDPALRVLPGKHLSNAPGLVGTGSVTWTPRIGDSGLHGLFYVDARLTSDYNTGSDLFPQKRQDAYALINARLGIRGPQRGGRSRSGRRICSTRITPRSRSTRRSRRARRRRRSSIRNSRAAARSSRPSSRSRGPSESPAGSGSERYLILPVREAHGEGDHAKHLEGQSGFSKPLHRASRGPPPHALRAQGGLPSPFNLTPRGGRRRPRRRRREAGGRGAPSAAPGSRSFGRSRRRSGRRRRPPVRHRSRYGRNGPRRGSRRGLGRGLKARPPGRGR
jgi:outer membrane receptor protein involved in Fe transport